MDSPVVRLAEAVNSLLGARRDLKDHVLHGTCSLSEVALLSRLDTGGPQRVTRLAETVGVDPSVVSRQVAALVDHALAERTPDPDDGRSHLVAVTAAGQDVLVDARARLHRTWDAALAGWSEAELDGLATAMSRLADDLTATRAGRPNPTRTHPARTHPTRTDPTRTTPPRPQENVPV